MTIKPEDVPVYPETLTLVPLEEPSRTVFAFLAVFPNGARVNVQAKYPANGVVDVTHAKEFSTKLVEALLRGNDELTIRKTNWTSTTAAIQRLLQDFNAKRHQVEQAEADIKSVILQ